MTNQPATPAQQAESLATGFLSRVWGPSHDLAAIDELMTEDYRITSGGHVVEGRAEFKEWVRSFQERYLDARTEILDVFANEKGDRVVSRWVNTGRNNGMFDLAPDGRPVSFTGIAMWRVEGGRLAECWVERAGLEAFRALTTPTR